MGATRALPSNGHMQLDLFACKGIVFSPTHEIMPKYFCACAIASLLEDLVASGKSSRFVRDGLGIRSGWRNPRKGCFCASLRAAKTTKMASWIKNRAENLDGSFFLRNFALAFENHPPG